jgi:hypothetical protein
MISRLSTTLGALIKTDRPSIESVVRLGGVDNETFWRFFQFIYSGEYEVGVAVGNGDSGKHNEEAGAGFSRSHLILSLISYPHESQSTFGFGRPSYDYLKKHSNARFVEIYKIAKDRGPSGVSKESL